MKNKVAEAYRDYCNNFLTVDGFASYYGIEKMRATRIIRAGFAAHEREAHRYQTGHYRPRHHRMGARP